jgi:polar amino acid transport system substrate-binding protein
MTRRLWHLLLLAGLVALASPPRMALAADGPIEVRLCFDDTPLPPWRSRHREGLYFDLLRAAADRAGVRFVFSPMAWVACRAAVQRGDMDGAFATAWSLDRLDTFVYPPGAPTSPRFRLRSDDVLLIRRRGEGPTVVGEGVRGLRGAIGVPAGYAIGTLLRDRGMAVFDNLPEPGDILSRVLGGRLAAAAITEGKWRELQRREAATWQALEADQTPLATVHYYLAFSRPFATASRTLPTRLWEAVDAAYAAPAFQQALRQATNDRAPPPRGR